MLSVLIPTYNYNTNELVREIQLQCENEGIYYEIIVLDDGSTDLEILKKNDKINDLRCCQFKKNNINQGRSTNMNLLSKKAKYDWFLFLDCDTFPKEKKFIKNYIKSIKESTKKIFFGGICYKITPPKAEETLRWKYGKHREEITQEIRKKNPYQNTLTSNLLIHKSIFEIVSFEEKIKEYGYEDLVFIENLRNNNFEIEHIDNYTYHLNYETSSVFIEKTKKALQTLVFIEKNKLTSEKTKIQSAYALLSKTKMVWLFRISFQFLEKIIYKNLTSKNPKIFLFDLYKLGYFCKIKNN